METEDQDAEAEFASAFNEDEMAEQSTEGESQVADSDVAGDAGQNGGGQPASDGVAVALNTEAPAAAEESASDIDKERQRLKSWEGRLKAREAEIESKAQQSQQGEEQGEEAADALESVAEAAQAKGSTEMAQAANAAAEAIEAGEISPEDAVAQLSEDFGEEFIKMIKAIVVATTKKEVEPVARTVDDVVSSLHSKEERAHFKAIADKHPDFSEIGKSDSFKSFIQGLPDDVRGDAENVAKGGSAEDVIALLDAFKESQSPANSSAQPSAEDTGGAESGMEDLEGVRSGGVRLPEKPSPSQEDYAGAWDQF